MIDRWAKEWGITISEMKEIITERIKRGWSILIRKNGHSGENPHRHELKGKLHKKPVKLKKKIKFYMLLS